MSPDIGVSGLREKVELAKKTEKADAVAPSKITRRMSKLPGRGAKYVQWWLYIPPQVAEHRSFPFQEGEDVVVAVEGERVVIEKLRARRA